MGKIATEADVKAVGGKGTATANKCCRKERVADLGCELTKARNTNQLVEEGTYKKSIIASFKCITFSDGNGVWGNNSGISFINNNDYTTVNVLQPTWTFQYKTHVAYSREFWQVALYDAQPNINVKITNRMNCGVEYVNNLPSGAMPGGGLAGFFIAGFQNVGISEEFSFTAQITMGRSTGTFYFTGHIIQN